MTRTWVWLTGLIIATSLHAQVHELPQDIADQLHRAVTYSYSKSVFEVALNIADINDITHVEYKGVSFEWESKRYCVHLSFVYMPGIDEPGLKGMIRYATSDEVEAIRKGYAKVYLLPLSLPKASSAFCLTKPEMTLDRYGRIVLRFSR